MAPGRPASAATLVVVTLGAFITTLDTNIVAAGAPSIARDLALDLTALQWVSIGYVLPFASVLLVAGSLVDRWGQRATLLAGLLAFGIGAAVGGLAGSAWLLIAARVVQGVAAAFVVPALLSMLRTNLEPKQRAVGAALWTASLAVALALGPAAGGLISEYLGWSWIFFVNLPFVAAMLVLVPATTTAGDGDRNGQRPAIASMVLVTAGLVLLTGALVDVGGVAGALPYVLGGAGIVVLAGFVLRERRVRHPLVAPELFADRRFAGALAVLLLWGLGVSGVFFFTPLLHQESLGLSPVQAGLPLILVAVGIVAVTPQVPRAVAAIGSGATISVGLVLVALGLAALAVINHIPEVAPRIPGLLLIGIGSALTTPLTSSSLELVREQDAGSASGLLTAARELSSALGVALVGAVLTAVRAGSLAAGATAGPALADGFTAGLWVAVALELSGAVLALVVIRRSRAEPVHRAPAPAVVRLT